jgi:hypothetical protein
LLVIELRLPFLFFLDDFFHCVPLPLIVIIRFSRLAACQLAIIVMYPLYVCSTAR